MGERTSNMKSRDSNSTSKWFSYSIMKEDIPLKTVYASGLWCVRLWFSCCTIHSHPSPSGWSHPSRNMSSRATMSLFRYLGCSSTRVQGFPSFDIIQEAAVNAQPSFSCLFNQHNENIFHACIEVKESPLVLKTKRNICEMATLRNAESLPPQQPTHPPKKRFLGIIRFTLRSSNIL